MILIFKPDFNMDLLLSSSYIGNVILVRRKLLDEVMCRLTLDKRINQTCVQCFKRICLFDIILRISTLDCYICHIPIPLYHDSGKSRIGYKNNMESALKNYLERQQIKAEVLPGMVKNTWHIRYAILKQSKISIIIANRNHKEDLKKCIESILRQSYSNVEIIIVENGSTDREIFQFYENLEANYNNIKILYWEKKFNYAAVNNYAAASAIGEYYLFLNNDIEFISENALEEMLSLCQREWTGAVGIKLYYPDGSVQHAGVIVGYGGIAGHAFLGCSGDTHGYMNRIDCVQNYSAVTAACMMVKRTVYNVCGGFDERFQIAFNDIDFCLKVREAGYDIVYSPYAEAWHFESKSRGAEDTYEKMKRFNFEVDLFRSKWMHIIKEGDPAYNLNLSLDKWDFSLKG